MNTPQTPAPQTAPELTNPLAVMLIASLLSDADAANRKAEVIRATAQTIAPALPDDQRRIVQSELRAIAAHYARVSLSTADLAKTLEAIRTGS